MRKMLISAGVGICVLVIVGGILWLKGPAGKFRLKQKQSPSESYSLLPKREGIEGRIIALDEMLFIGNDIKDSKGMQNLYKMGVRKIVSITPTPVERRLCEAFGIQLIELPYGMAEIPTALVDTFLVTIQNMNSPLYIHGADKDERALLLGAIYRIYLYKWPFDRSISEYVALGGDNRNDTLLISSLKTYDLRKKRR